MVQALQPIRESSGAGMNSPELALGHNAPAVAPPTNIGAEPSLCPHPLSRSSPYSAAELQTKSLNIVPKNSLLVLDKKPVATAPGRNANPEKRRY
jgi:hypothetical protein